MTKHIKVRTNSKGVSRTQLADQLRIAAQPQLQAVHFLHCLTQAGKQCEKCIASRQEPGAKDFCTLAGATVPGLDGHICQLKHLLALLLPLPFVLPPE
jgi:hypothetical protein